jgi:hypothetical protein
MEIPVESLPSCLTALRGGKSWGSRAEPETVAFLKGEKTSILAVAKIGKAEESQFGWKNSAVSKGRSQK